MAVSTNETPNQALTPIVHVITAALKSIKTFSSTSPPPQTSLNLQVLGSPSTFLPRSLCHCAHVFYHNFDPQKGILTRYQNKNLYFIWEQLQSEVGCTGPLSPRRVFFIK